MAVIEQVFTEVHRKKGLFFFLEDFVSPLREADAGRHGQM